MFDAFVNKDLGEGQYFYEDPLALYLTRFLELQTLLQGCIPDSATDKGIENEVEQVEAPPPKRKRRSRKTIVDDDDDDVPSSKPCDSTQQPVADARDVNGREQLSDATSLSVKSNRGNHLEVYSIISH